MKMRIVLVGLYIACELIANVTASKPVQLGGMVVPAAIFIYTLTFTLIDLISQPSPPGTALLQPGHHPPSQDWEDGG